MHFSAPSHPLIYAFLLQQENFCHARKLIVENQEQGEKLLHILEAWQSLQKIPQNKCARSGYRLIRTSIDLIEWSHDVSLVGIFPLETLDLHVKQKELDHYCLELKKGMKYSEEQCITWLSEHGYVAKKSEEVGTYFRAGDTISVPLSRGILSISFFGTTLEDLFLKNASITSVWIYSRPGSLPEEQIS